MGRKAGSPQQATGQELVRIVASVYTREQQIIRKVMERYNLDQSQALRVILNDWAQANQGQVQSLDQK